MSLWSCYERDQRYSSSEGVPRCVPEDLPGLPPKHDVEFTIVLKPGTTLIS